MSWPLVPLRRIVTCLDGRRVPLNREQRSYMHGAVPYWGAGGIVDYIDCNLFDEPLVLLGEDGAPFFTPGKDVAYFVEGPTWINNHIHALRPIAVDGQFLAYALNSVDYAAHITGSTRDKLTQDDMRAIQIALPRAEEQRRIAAFLDAETARIDRMLRLQSEVVLRFNERDAAQLDSAIDHLARQFGTAPLRRFILGVDQGASPQCDAVPAGEDEWGVLKVSCLRPGSFYPEENKRLPDVSFADPRSEVRAGDLLIVRANTPQLVGSTAVVRTVRTRLLLSDKIFRVRVDRRLLTDFVAAVARGRRIRDLCAASSNGASQSMANIRFEEVKTWPIPAAPIDEQVKFVEQMRQQQAAVLVLRAKVERQATLLAERRQALITAAVTGQFDVSSASGRGVTDGVSA